MIGRLKMWIGRVARQQLQDNHPVPSLVAHNAPTIQVFKINNGYLVTKDSGSPYRESNQQGAVFCATPMEVASLILKGETMQKMGMHNPMDVDKTQTQPMHTHGMTSAKLSNQI